MATAINLATTGAASGTPLTAAGITLGAATEEDVTFTNLPSGGIKLVLVTALTDATFDYTSGNTGAKLNPNVDNVIQAFNGRTLYLKSTGGGVVYLRVA